MCLALLCFFIKKENFVVFTKCGWLSSENLSQKMIIKISISNFLSLERQSLKKRLSGLEASVVNKLALTRLDRPSVAH